MKNMPRSQIEEIATNILNNGDIIAKHGTSVQNALSIISTGFNFSRKSYVIQKTKNIDHLCGYGWKENGPDDATNVVIEVPREFFMDLLNMSNIDEYNKWIKNIRDKDLQRDVLDIVTTYEYFKSKSDGEFYVPTSFKAHIPQEFIVGAFIWCNGKTYLRLEDGESALDNLSFVPNDRFYLNLSPDERENFLNEMRGKIGISNRRK